MYAEIIVNVTSSNVDTEFTYLIPPHMESLIKVGTRVKVPFGNGNRTIMGYVLRIKSENDNPNITLKEITELVDLSPIITERQIVLAKYIKEDTLSPLIRILNLMIPESLHLKTIKYIHVLNYEDLDANLATLFGGKSIIKFTNSYNNYLPRIKKAIDNGYLKITYDAIQETKEKIVSKYTLNELEFTNNSFGLKTQIKDSLKLLKGKQPLTKQEILDEADISEYSFNKYNKLKFFNEIKVRVSRTKNYEIATRDRFVKNNPIYDEVVNKINSGVEKPVLWISKDLKETESVIERTVRQNLSNDRTTLIICPDILGSFKFASLIRRKIKVPVACINSNLTSTEYLDLFNEIRDNEFRIVVTTPKGGLLEYPNLETIIMVDSENDCYYNAQSPRYDLKRVMQVVSRIYNAHLCYHTFFPSLDEYTMGIKGTYSVIEHQDFANEDLNVQVVDLKEELLRANSTSISSKLIQKLKITKARNKQSLLISNRKYYSNFIMCRSCGEIVKCPKCDIAMQYSQKNNNLICPACGLKKSMISTCEICQSETLRMEGTGIEQIAKTLQETLPDFKITTITASNYDEVYEKMSQIEDDNIDIIVSTDLFSRSVIDKNIGLICIMNLDEVVGNPNFLSNERAFSMLIHAYQKITDNEEALMLIQTFNPDNYVIKSFISGDYKEYLKEEIRNRKLQNNTPFYNINRIFIKARYEEMYKEAWNIRNLLQSIFKNNVYVIGPTYNKMYQAVQLIVKHQNNDIYNYYQKIYERYQSTGVTIIFDKYPRYI